MIAWSTWTGLHSRCPLFSQKHYQAPTLGHPSAQSFTLSSEEIRLKEILQFNWSMNMLWKSLLLHDVWLHTNHSIPKITEQGGWIEYRQRFRMRVESSTKDITVQETYEAKVTNKTWYSSWHSRSVHSPSIWRHLSKPSLRQRDRFGYHSAVRANSIDHAHMRGQHNTPGRRG